MARRAEDLTGKNFGRLTVLRRAERADGVKWECLCVCGNHTIADSRGLQRGTKQSCGCRRTEYLHGRVRHGALSHYWTEDA